ncbi:hypothetical protein LguiA_013555 [Lonicera macranthoides]
MMEKFRGITIPFLFLLIILFPLFIPAYGKVEEKSSASQKMRDAYELLKTSSFRSWDKFKSIVSQMQTQFLPPNLDFKKDKEGIKEAAEKSFDGSRVAMEESAKSAADVVGEAVHVTKDKVKEKMAREDERKTEL